MSKVIGIDIDGILADTGGGITEALRERYGIDLPLEQMTCYYLETCTGVTDEQMRSLMLDPAFYRALRPIEGAVQGLRTLLNGGYTVVLITARPAKETWAVTLEWLRTWSFPYHSLQFSGNKASVAGNYGAQLFVEDKLETALELAAAGLSVYLLDWPWNQQRELPENIKRVYSWEELISEIT